MAQPLISVIMPCYNAAATLAQSIESVLRQSHRALELIVVDDGSGDASPQLLAALDDPRLRALSQPNRGVCHARNRGIAAAGGEFIAFLDADDTWDARFLEQMLAALQARPEAALAYCGWQNLGMDGKAGEPFVPPDYENAGKIAALLRNCRWPIHAALTRRAAIEQAGGFDARFPTSEDFLLWLKIGAARPLVRVPEVLAFYHHHGAQVTKNALRMIRSHWQVQHAFLDEHPEIAAALGARRIAELTDGELLRQAYRHYWQGSLSTARPLFRMVMMHRYGNARDWLYMLPSLLPLPLHRALLKASRRGAEIQ